MVERPRHHDVHPVSFHEDAGEHFLGDARHCIRAHRRKRVVFPERQVVLAYVPIFLRGADGKDPAFYSKAPHGFKHVQEHVGVVLEARDGVLPAVGNAAVRGQVEYKIRLELVDDVSHLVAVQEVDLFEGAGYALVGINRKSRREEIDSLDHGLLAKIIEVFKEVPAYEAGEAGDEDSFHGLIECIAPMKRPVRYF